MTCLLPCTVYTCTYQCFFSVVTDAPVSLTTFRQSITKLYLDWMSFNENVTGTYTVFINGSDGLTGNTTTNDTELLLSSLRPDVTYTIRLVSTGEDLPSEILTDTSPAGKKQYAYYYCTCIYSILVKVITN